MPRARSGSKSKKGALDVEQLIASKIRDPYSTRQQSSSRAGEFQIPGGRFSFSAIQARCCHAEWGSKKNDANNPNNLWNLGEFRGGVWEAVPPQVKALGAHPAVLLRQPATLPAGLFNLGATCYLNTQLQVLFHCLEFRSAIYAWKPPKDDHSAARASAAVAETAVAGAPGSVLKTPAMRHAQLRAMQQLFASMQLSAQRCVSTAPFAAVYNLASGVQQDVQEFFKLFVSHMEESLATAPHPTIRNVLQRQFRGQASWVNNCLTCDYSSRNSEAFYELQVQTSGLTTLHESLHDFCEVVSLSGSAQYACPQCDEKRDAVRFQKIDTLPPVLHVQLSRYGYDYATGQKKKHHDAMHVPDILNMSHVEATMQQRRQAVAAAGGQSDDETAAPPLPSSATAPSTGVPQLYELCAVLYHHGRSANYGHYTCDVWDDERAAWFHFDDAIVTQLTPPAPSGSGTEPTSSSAGPSTAAAAGGNGGGSKRGQKRDRASNTGVKGGSESAANTGATNADSGDIIEIHEEVKGGCLGDTLGVAAFEATAAFPHAEEHGGAGGLKTEQWCSGCIPQADACPEPALEAATSGLAPPLDPPMPTERRDYASRALQLAEMQSTSSAPSASHTYPAAASAAYPQSGTACTPAEYQQWCSRRRHPGMSAASGSGTRTAYMLVYKRVGTTRAQRWHTMQCAVGAGQVSSADIDAVAHRLHTAQQTDHTHAHARSSTPQQSQDSLSFSQSSDSIGTGPSVAFDSQELLSGTGSQASGFLSPRPPRHAPPPATASAVKRACAAAAQRAREFTSPPEGGTLPPASSLQDLLAPAGGQHANADTDIEQDAAAAAAAPTRRTLRARGAQKSYAVDSSDDEAAAHTAAPPAAGRDLRAMLQKMATRPAPAALRAAGTRSRSNSSGAVSADSSDGEVNPPKRRRSSRNAPPPSPTPSQSDEDHSIALPLAQGAVPHTQTLSGFSAQTVRLDNPEQYVGPKAYAVDVLPPPPCSPYEELASSNVATDDVQEVKTAQASRSSRTQSGLKSPDAAPLPLSLLPPLQLCSALEQWNSCLAQRAAQWVQGAHRAWALALARRAAYEAIFANEALNPHASVSSVTVTSVKRAAEASKRKPQWYWVPTAWLRAWIAGEKQPSNDDSPDSPQDGDPSQAASAAPLDIGNETVESVPKGSASSTATDAGDDDIVALDGSDDDADAGPTAGASSESAGDAGPTAAQAEELRQKLASLLQDSLRTQYAPQDRLAAPGFALFAPLPPPPGRAEGPLADSEPEQEKAAREPSPRSMLLLGSISDVAAAVDTPPAEMQLEHLLTSAETFGGAAGGGNSKPMLLPHAVPHMKRVITEAYDALMNTEGTAVRKLLGDARLASIACRAWQELTAWAAGDAPAAPSANARRKAALKGEAITVQDQDTESAAPPLPWVAAGSAGDEDWMQDSWLTREVKVDRHLHSGNFISPSALQLWMDTLSASRSNHSDTAQLISLLSEPEAAQPNQSDLTAARDEWVTACLQEMRSRSKRASSRSSDLSSRVLQEQGVQFNHLLPLASDFEAAEESGRFRLPDGTIVLPPETGTCSGGEDENKSGSDADSTVLVHDASENAVGHDTDQDSDDSEPPSADGPSNQPGNLSLMRSLSQSASLWVERDSPMDVFLVSRAFVRALKARAEQARKAHAGRSKGKPASKKKASAAASASLMSSFLAGSSSAPPAGGPSEVDAALVTPNADLVGPRGYVHDLVNRRTAMFVRRGVWEAVQGSYPKAVPMHLLVAQTDPWIALSAARHKREQEEEHAKRQAETGTRCLKTLAKRQGPMRVARHGTVGSSPLPPGTYALVPRQYLQQWRAYVNGSSSSCDLGALSWTRWSVSSSEPGADDSDGLALKLPTHVLAFLSRVAPVSLPAAKVDATLSDGEADSRAHDQDAPAPLALAYSDLSSAHASDQDVLAATGPVEDFDIVPLDEWLDLLRIHPELKGPVSSAPRRSGVDTPFHTLVEEDPTPSKRKRGKKRKQDSPPGGYAKQARKGGAQAVSSTPQADEDSDVAEVCSGDEGGVGLSKGGDSSLNSGPDDPNRTITSDSDGGGSVGAAALDTVTHGALYPRDSAEYRHYCAGLVAPVLRILPCTKSPLLPAHIMSAASTFGQPCPDKAVPDACIWWTDPPLDEGHLRQQLAAAHAASFDFTGRAIFIKLLAPGEVAPGVQQAVSPSATAASGAGGAFGEAGGEDEDIALVQEPPGAAKGSDDEDFVDTDGALAAAASPPASRSARSRRRGRRDLMQVAVNSADTPGEVLIKCFQEHDVGLGGRLWYKGAPLHGELSLAQAGVPAGATLYLEAIPGGEVDLASAMSAAGGAAAAAPEAGFSGSAFLS